MMKQTTVTFELNPLLKGLNCLRCDRQFAPDDEILDKGTGCPNCLAEGFPVSLVCRYDSGASQLNDGSTRRMLRFSPLLPYKSFPTIGEGDTPLVDLPRLASRLGVQRVFFKNEGQNPTGSHKDRMSGLAIARAHSRGKDTVVAASSGNAGASLAAYAANAGLKCVIVSMSSISPMWEAAIEFHGAELHIRQGQDDRWGYMQQMVEKKGWYPVTNFLNPPSGSNPFGIEGYKTIAYEIVEQIAERAPLAVLVPTCRGDVIAGIWYGFVDAHQRGLISVLPRLIAVEPGARLERVLDGEDYRIALPVPAHQLSSIGGETATYQSYHALKESKGMAVSVTTRAALSAQKTLGAAGLYVELSSAAALAGAEKLAGDSQFFNDETLIILGTSHGYKEMTQKHSWSV
ncbi:MAG: pyridoxal-phosphate dependent enzyme [Candidatus Obscuribacterales bacterium]|nr:pyridoxal-phosphate dependent enzyme [Candidatus Obscuribacterales bacterium]